MDWHMRNPGLIPRGHNDPGVGPWARPFLLLPNYVATRVPKVWEVIQKLKVKIKGNVINKYEETNKILCYRYVLLHMCIWMHVYLQICYFTVHFVMLIVFCVCIHLQTSMYRPNEKEGLGTCKLWLHIKQFFKL